MKRAYSYIRFSTREQLKGRSLERQTEAAAAYCRAHGLVLDTELSLHDLGVSAFRGKNADTGALGQFMKAVHVGAVPKGSFLLVETFDRLSREYAYDAQLTLQNIIHAGITVVTLMNGKQYNTTILRNDSFALVEAIVLMTRSHEESATKSARILDAWQRKRQRAHTGVAMTKIIPAWLALDAKRKPRPIPARVKVVREIFEMFNNGTGKIGIAKEFNRRKIPTFGRSAYWEPTYIFKILTNRAVLGEFQPHKEVGTGRVRKRAPDGPVLKNYYPAIIDRRTFNKAQAIFATVTRRVPMTNLPLKNLLAGLARCPSCDALMVRTFKGVGQPSKLVCPRARSGAGCLYRSVPTVRVEQSLTANAETLFASLPDADATLTARIEQTEAALRAIDTKLFDLTMLLDGTPSKTLAERIQKEEATKEALAAELEALQARSLQTGVRIVRENARRMRDALAWHATDPSDIPGVNAALRACFEKIVVNYKHERLELHWRHAPPATVLPYA